MAKNNKLYLYTDGGSRGNPGAAAIGIVICDSKKDVLYEYAECTGHLTSNQAEYTALINGLDKCAEYTQGNVTCYSDSELMIKQMKGKYRIRNEQLIELSDEAKKNMKVFKKVRFRHVRRTNEFIQRADELLNDALDDNIED